MLKINLLIFFIYNTCVFLYIQDANFFKKYQVTQYDMIFVYLISIYVFATSVYYIYIGFVKNPNKLKTKDTIDTRSNCDESKIWIKKNS